MLYRHLVLRLSCLPRDVVAAFPLVVSARSPQAGSRRVARRLPASDGDRPADSSRSRYRRPTAGGSSVEASVVPRTSFFALRTSHAP